MITVLRSLTLIGSSLKKGEPTSTPRIAVSKTAKTYKISGGRLL
jgi:hypothetical protein